MRRILFTLLGLALALPAAAAPDGAKLFAQNCAACHGSDGRGGVGVPLALPDFLGSVSDRFLIATIRHGRPGRVMPSFKQLSDAQVRAIVAHLRSWMPKGMPTPSAGDVPVAGNVLHGKVLFAQNCAVCHGANGQGGSGTGVTFSRPRNLPIIPPALNNPGFLAAASDRMIKTTLMHGRRGTPMVSFLKKGLTERDIDDIVSYVRSFSRHPLHWRPGNDDKPVLEEESSYSLEQTVENVKRAAIGHNFRIIRVQTLENGLFPPDQEDKHEVIIYFCDFGFVNKALALDPRVGLFMPCRVTVVERHGKVMVMSINPKYLSRLYNNADLDKPCNEMTQDYQNILDEATL